MINFIAEYKNNIYFPNETIDCWQTIIDECISNLNVDIRQVGLNALKTFSNTLYSNSKYIDLICIIQVVPSQTSNE
jgi:hypothetical protein